MFAVIDFETTGLSPQQGARAIEIGVVITDGLKILDTYHSLMNPGVRVPTEITRITGIREAMVRSAPAIDTVMHEAVQFIGDLPLVAHNASFDRKFYERETRNIRMVNSPFLCTMLIGRRLYPFSPNHQLATLARLNHISTSGHHRALADADMTAQLLHSMIEDLEDLYVNQRIDAAFLRKYQNTTKANAKSVRSRRAAPSSPSPRPLRPLETSRPLSSQPHRPPTPARPACPAPPPVTTASKLDNLTKKLMLATDPKASPAIIDSLLEGGDFDVTMAILRRSDSAQHDWVDQAFEKFGPAEQMRASRDHHLPEEALYWLVSFGEPVIYPHLFIHPGLTEDMLDDLIEVLESPEFDEFLDDNPTPWKQSEDEPKKISWLRSLLFAALEHPKCSPDYLDTIARTTNWWNTTPDDEDDFVRRIVENPNTADATLSFLYWHTPYQGPIWQYINTNPRCSDMGRQLALKHLLDDSVDAAEAYLEWEHFHPGMLPVLAESASWVVKKQVAANWRTPSEILVRLSNLVAAKDIRYSGEIDDSDLEDEYPEYGPSHVRRYATENNAHPMNQARQSCSAQQLEELVDLFPSHEVKLAAAGNEHINEKLALVLSEDHSVGVRVALGKNLGVSERVLDVLSRDNDQAVRSSVAQSKNCNRVLLTTLASDSSPEVRLAVAGNLITPLAVLATFYADPSSEVRLAVLKSKKCPPQFIARLAEDPIDEWRVLAAQHHLCQPATFVLLANDRVISVRTAVMNNKHCPLDIRAKLLHAL